MTNATASNSECATPSGAGDKDEPGSSTASGDSDVPPEPGEPVPKRTDHTEPAYGAGAVVVDVDADPSVRSRVNIAWVSDRLLEAVAYVDRPVARIGLSLVDDRRMADLHVKHAGQEGTTDVLTFELSEPDEPIDVDIAVCVDLAQRRADERGLPIEREVLLYAVHGLLHCAGFGDHDPEGFDAMHAEEDRILQAIGVGATFHRDGENSGGGRS